VQLGYAVTGSVPICFELELELAELEFSCIRSKQQTLQLQVATLLLIEFGVSQSSRGLHWHGMCEKQRFSTVAQPV
jgi:hypothetical protein